MLIEFSYRPKVSKVLLIYYYYNLQVQKHQILIALDEAFFTLVKTPPNRPARTQPPDVPNIPGPAVVPWVSPFP